MSHVIGLYQPGRSPLHRLPAGWKFLGLLVFAGLVVVFDRPWQLGVFAGVVCAGFAAARLRPGLVLRTMRTVLVLLGIVFALQWWLLGPESAVVVCLRLLVAIGAANLFTLTTRVDDLVAAIERGASPLRRVGVSPELLGLLVGLTIRAVSALSVIAQQTREAQRARDASRSVAAFAVPFLIRTLRHADELGEALAARGVGDEAGARDEEQQQTDPGAERSVEDRSEGTAERADVSRDE
ncbi:biotin transport system permease protein [Actinopolyspora mzabensis]|uniref:Biotin transport system permease protein n=1 Tax=Actinopolyspora mzabensis TaxID=995066 RepID=A0A1G9FNA1_ACTMZ|nr:energy-coupling factor transporter transmembrane component T [Actinopolyspora mzabensis]SDK89861.1 biotin transport system permease protein [Actinopolyspora mzabensis]